MIRNTLRCLFMVLAIVVCAVAPLAFADGGAPVPAEDPGAGLIPVVLLAAGMAGVSAMRWRKNNKLRQSSAQTVKESDTMTNPVGCKIGLVLLAGIMLCATGPRAFADGTNPPPPDQDPGGGLISVVLFATVAGVEAIRRHRKS